VKLVHLVSFIIKISVTMHGHMNVKFNFFLCLPSDGTHELQKLDEARDHTVRILQVSK